MKAPSVAMLSLLLLAACGPIHIPTYAPSSPSPTSTEIAAVAQRNLCRLALSMGAEPPSWDTRPAYRRHSLEAQRQGLTPQQCAQILGRTSQVAQTSKPAHTETGLASMPQYSLCALVTVPGRPLVWETISRYRKHVTEAKRRGLTPQQCARVLGRTTPQVGSVPKSASGYMAVVRPHNLCFLAITPLGRPPAWDYGRDGMYVKEALSRGFTPQRCAEILRRPPQVAERPKARPKKIEQVAPAPIPRKKPAPKTPEVAEKPPSPEIVVSTSGSGFFVSKLGHVVTNEHVVKECKTITVGDNANRQVSVEVIETDRRNDLALLKLSSTSMASAETKSLISKLGIQIASKAGGGSAIPLSSNGLLRFDDVELGETVMVAGYPFGDIFSNTIKVTGGMVSAIRGMGDDSGQFQMDAAAQPGNSGGPIYDEKGNIVGVVVAQLNKLKVAKAIGSLPENVNFGIKASTVRQFLTSSGLPTKWSERSQPMPTIELAKIAKSQTVMVICNQ